MEFREKNAQASLRTSLSLKVSFCLLTRHPLRYITQTRCVIHVKWFRHKTENMVIIIPRCPAHRFSGGAIWNMNIILGPHVQKKWNPVFFLYSWRQVLVSFFFFLRIVTSGKSLQQKQNFQMAGFQFVCVLVHNDHNCDLIFHFNAKHLNGARRIYLSGSKVGRPSPSRFFRDMFRKRTWARRSRLASQQGDYGYLETAWEKKMDPVIKRWRLRS